MLTKLKDLLVEEMDINPELIKPEAELMNDLGFNSLELADLVVLCEEKFNVIFDEASLPTLLTVGDVVKATVKQILKDYAIVSFGDIMAYLPSSEYSWGRDNNLKNKLKLGTELNVVVIQITDKGVMVSVKRMSKDPWLDVETLYQVNHQAKGKIKKLQGYGAFVELSDGIQGLLHKKEMSLDGMKEPSEIVSEGQEIDVIITSIEKAERKISFSIKPFLN